MRPCCLRGGHGGGERGTLSERQYCALVMPLDSFLKVERADDSSGNTEVGKMKHLLFFLALLSCLVLAACSASPTPDLEATVQAAVAATQAAQPTNMFTPEQSDTPTPEPLNTPVPTEPPTTSTLIPLSRADDNGVQKQAGSWGMKLYDVKRATGVYYSNDAEVPLGVWLLSFVEVTNLGTGTNSPWKDLDFYLLDDRGWSYDAGWNRACGYASLQFQVGHIMDDINPGLTLGVVMAVDVPGDMGDVWLRVEQDPDFAIYLGNASSIPLE